MNKKIDFDTVNKHAIADIAMSLGISFDKRGKTFCPCSTCSDNQSKNKGASLNRKNNTLHCFVCNETWDVWTLTGMMQFGFTKRECYTKDNVEAIADYLESYGVTGIETIEKEENFLNRIFVMPTITFPGYYGIEETKEIKLHNLIGIKRNPFIKVPIKTDTGTIEDYRVDKTFACIIMFEKTLGSLIDLQKEKESLDDYLKSNEKIEDMEDFYFDFDTNLIKIKALNKYLQQMNKLFQALEPGKCILEESDYVRKVFETEDISWMEEILPELYEKGMEYTYVENMDLAL